MEELRRLSLSISPAQNGQSVLQILRRDLQLSAACVRRAKRLPEGITLDGSRVFTNGTVRTGQLLCVLIGAPTGTIAPTAGDLDIRYEDDDLLIVNKPAGLMVHPRFDERSDTLANYLQYHYLQTGSSAQIHLVNRLDRGTSGLMAVAKHPHAHARLIAALHGAEFSREYLTVCDGTPNPPDGLLDFPIARAEDSPIRREVRQGGAIARTHYQTLQSDGMRSLLALRLETGRTHQIRVHLAHIGCPVTGDFLYGSEHPELPRRFALHCARLVLTHPLSGEKIVQTAALPPELRALLTPRAQDFPLTTQGDLL